MDKAELGKKDEKYDGEKKRCMNEVLKINCCI